MAEDIRMGGAWIDVGFRFEKFDKDVKEATSRAKGAAKKIEDSFMVKYTKGFLDKGAMRAEESRIRRLTEDRLDAEEEIARTRLQGIQQANRAAAQSPSMKGSNRAGMIGAQLSYAAQDFITGLSMGNLNQALLGASNNLSMIAMQFGAMGGMITSVALAALPMLVTAWKAFNDETDNAKEREIQLKAAIERTNEAFERRMKLLQIQAGMRRAGEPIEAGDIKQAVAANAPIKELEKNIKQLTTDAAEVAKKRVELAGQLGGLGDTVTPPGGVDLKTKDQRDAAGLLKRRENELRVIKENPPKFGVIEFKKGRFQKQLEAAAQKRLDDDRKTIAMDQGYDDTHRAFLNAQGKIDIIRMRTAEDRANLEKKDAELEQKSQEIAVEIQNAEARRKELMKHREELLRRDLGFMQRTANAGFNNYERAKIELEKKHIQERQELRDKGFDKVPLGPRMTELEKEKRITASHQRELDEVDATVKEMTDERDKKRERGKRLTDKEVKAYMGRIDAIQEGGIKEREKIEKEFKEGPGTLMDPAMKALKTEQARERALLAQKFANQGQEPGHFTGIEGLSRDVQSRIGDKGIDFAQQTADNTKGILQAQQDLITAMKDLKPGLGP